MHVLLLAKCVVPRSQLDADDRDVPGTYRIELDDATDRDRIASAALDGFHTNVAVGDLESFEFTVHDFDTGRELHENHEVESYENSSSCRSVEKLSSTLDSLCVAALKRSSSSPSP